MDDQSWSIDSMIISLPCELLRGCLQSSDESAVIWEGESPDSEGPFPIKTVLRESENVVEFDLSGVSVVFSSQSIRFNICKAQKKFNEAHSPTENCEKLLYTAQTKCSDTSIDKDSKPPIEDVVKREENSAGTLVTNLLDDSDILVANSSKHVIVCDEISTQNSNETEPEKPKPKKRGRKPKSKSLENCTGPAVQVVNEEQSGRKRYGLRGVKLSPAVMEAIRGKMFVDDEDLDAAEVDDEDADQEDYVEEKDTMFIDSVDDETKVMSNAEAQTDYEAEVDGKSSLDVENSASLRLGINGRKKKSNVKGSLKMLKKFKDAFLNREKGIERKKILATIGNVYSKERRKKNIDKTASCKYCGKRFCDYTGVDSHVKKFHMKEKDVKEYLEELVPLKQVTCPTCNVVFASRLLLQVHEDRDHSKTISQCTVCGKVFRNLQFLRNHIKTIHLNDETHLCHLCSSKFKQAITLKQHIEEVHERQRNVTCKVCGKMFYRQAQLNRHSRIHDANGKKIVCQVCGRGFNFECNLQRHLSIVHTPKSEKFHCSYCGKGFNQKATMSAHVQKIHFNLCPFVCEICKSPFMRSKQIEDHMAQAHNAANFKIANPREKLFKYNRSSDDMFSCSYCQENFCYKAQLVDHVQTAHLDVFPYSCEHCQHGFLEKSFLLRHQGKAHGIQPESLSTADQQLLQVIPATDSKRLTVVPLAHAINMSDMSITKTEIDNHGNLQDAVLTVIPSDSVTEAEIDAAVAQEEDISTAASVLVEISNDENTIQYVIQGGENLDMDSSNAVVHDIASLLLAAEQSMQENAGSVTLTTVDESEAVAMETSEVTHVETPSVITISNISGENSDMASIEGAAAIAESSQLEEITVIMKE